jgi:hypothetical protein
MSGIMLAGLLAALGGGDDTASVDDARLSFSERFDAVLAVPPAQAAAPQPGVWGARAGFILPLADDADTDILFGIGGTYRQAIDKKSFWQIGADLFFGGGDVDVGFGSPAVDYDVTFFMAHGLYGQYLEEGKDAPNGFCWFAGGGIAYEMIDIDLPAGFGDDSEENFALILEGGGSYGFSDRFAVTGELMIFLGTDTVEIGLLAAFEVRF